MCAFCKKLTGFFKKKLTEKQNGKQEICLFICISFQVCLLLAASLYMCIYMCIYMYMYIYIHIAVYICSCLNSISKYYPNLCLPCLAMPIFSLFSTFIPWLISVFITIFLFHSVASTSATLLSIHFYILPMNNSIYPKTLSS